jgi:hypothetical protein
MMGTELCSWVCVSAEARAVCWALAGFALCGEFELSVEDFVNQIQSQLMRAGVGADTLTHSMLEELRSSQVCEWRGGAGAPWVLATSFLNDCTVHELPLWRPL